MLSFNECYKRGQSKAASNILLFIIHLYTFEASLDCSNTRFTDTLRALKQTISCGLLYDIIRVLCDRFTTLDVELLLLMLQSTISLSLPRARASAYD